jgi:hypothetical protein
MLTLGISLQNILIGFSFLVAAVLLLACAFILRKKFEYKCSADLLGSAAWSFSDSWASTFTGVSAVLGLFLALGLEFQVQVLNQKAFALLNFFFAIIVLAAALVYKATGKTVVQADGEHFQGKLWAFFLAAFLTLWAVFGQIGGFITALFGLLPLEIVSRLEFGLFILLMLMVVVLLGIHTWRSLDAVLATQLKKDGREFAPGQVVPTPKKSFPLL